jgi:NifB/MoaA-like Fe-S oxidoreductase
MKRVNYLNNRDLLKQIHLSKNTYCSYVRDEDAYYDIIVKDIKKINNSTISQAKKLRAKRMTQEAWEITMRGEITLDRRNAKRTIFFNPRQSHK